MTNFEKYFGELKTGAFAVVMGKPVDCDGDVPCDACDLFYNTDVVDCYDARMEWLKAEYTDPPETIIPEDTPIDTRVLVSSDGIKWRKKYYAGALPALCMTARCIRLKKTLPQLNISLICATQ